MSKVPIIALVTDFSLNDPYIGIMKGVILEINPNVIIVDLAHDLPNFNINFATFVLLTSYKYFPKGTIFVCVIDPGVGTKREAIIVKTKNYIFVGPNNGVMSLAALEDGIIEIRKIENKEYMLRRVSYTFHGRDIFSPAAAWISRGVPLETFGQILDRKDFISIKISKPVMEDGVFTAEVLAIDGFGNIITNIKGEDFLKTEKFGYRYCIIINEKAFLARFVRTYGDAQKNETILLIGSHEYIEIAVNMGSAAKRLKINIGDKIKIIRLELCKNLKI